MYAHQLRVSPINSIRLLIINIWFLSIVLQIALKSGVGNLLAQVPEYGI